MRRRRHTIAIMVLLGLGLTAAAVSTVRAEMVSLDSSAMAGIMGRSGLNLQPGATTLDLAIGRLYYRDDDGVDAAGQPGYLSLDGLSLKGTITSSSAPALNVLFLAPGLSILTLPALTYAIHDLVLQIDEFQIDAIRVGTAPGTGPSFGSIGISHLTMHLEGNIQVSVSNGLQAIR